MMENVILITKIDNLAEIEFLKYLISEIKDKPFCERLMKQSLT